MRYALVDGEIKEATRGSCGFCICCGAEVIAKCGEIRIPHWAHKNQKECPYSKKEAKTQWHIDWQNCFPKKWQEVRCKDPETGEIHVADVKIPNDLVIEFQHSAIKPEELAAREKYHEKMIWVVDGTRLKNDFSRFAKNIKSQVSFLAPVKETNIHLYIVSKEDEVFPKSWLMAMKACYFDFKLDVDDNSDSEYNKLLRKFLWGFFKLEPYVVAIQVPRDCFADYAKKGILRRLKFTAAIELTIRYELQKEKLKEKLKEISREIRKVYRPRLYRRHFRF